MPLQTTITAQVRAVQTQAADLGDGQFRLSRADPRIVLTPGTGAGQADRLWSDTRTLNASANEDLDLTSGLLDGLGGTVNLATVKAIWLKAHEGNTNDVILGAAATNTFLGPFGDPTDTIAVQPGGVALLVAPGSGWTVTPATGMLLRLANGGGGTAVDFDIVIVGVAV